MQRTSILCFALPRSRFFNLLCPSGYAWFTQILDCVESLPSTSVRARPHSNSPAHSLHASPPSPPGTWLIHPLTFGVSFKTTIGLIPHGLGENRDILYPIPMSTPAKSLPNHYYLFVIQYLYLYHLTVSSLYYGKGLK